MPEVVVYAMEGRGVTEKHALMREITDAVVRHFGVNPDLVTVQIVEAPADNKSKGGLAYSVRHPREILIGSRSD